MNKTERIKAKILDVLPGATVEVRDPYQDGEHFEALVISAQFEGMPLVKQHQLVMNALKADFAQDVHALALTTRTV